MFGQRIFWSVGGAVSGLVQFISMETQLRLAEVDGRAVVSKNWINSSDSPMLSGLELALGQLAPGQLDGLLAEYRFSVFPWRGCEVPSRVLQFEVLCCRHAFRRFS